MQALHRSARTGPTLLRRASNAIFHPSGARTFADLRVPPQASHIKPAPRREGEAQVEWKPVANTLPATAPIKSVSWQKICRKDNVEAKARVMRKQDAAMSVLETTAQTDPARASALRDLVEAMQDQAHGFTWECVYSTQEPVPDASPRVEVARFQLKSGKSVFLETVRSDDVQALTRFINCLSDDSSAFRFPDRMSRGGDMLAARIVGEMQSPDPSQQIVTLVLRDDEQRIVGLADYAPAPDAGQDVDLVEKGKRSASPGRKTCEVSVVIDDALRGQGAGSHLLDDAITHARGAGYERVLARVSRDNTATLKMLSNRGSSAVLPADANGYMTYVLYSESRAS